MTKQIAGPYSKPQASGLGKLQKGLGEGKTAIYKNWHKENVIKPFKGKKGKGLRRLNKGGFVKGPNS
tara:strand:- start:680 stop:880 length:201 start_codon:yes stop_codon:yes gene_type:complete